MYFYKFNNLFLIKIKSNLRFNFTNLLKINKLVFLINDFKNKILLFIINNPNFFNIFIINLFAQF